MEKTIKIFADGGSRGNPGPAAIGIYITDENKNEIFKFGKKIGFATNNVAEYTAVIEALAWVKDQPEKPEKIIFKIDSLLVVNQLNCKFKVKESHLKELILKIRGLENLIGINIVYEHIPRENNLIADLLVNNSF